MGLSLLASRVVEFEVDSDGARRRSNDVSDDFVGAWRDAVLLVLLLVLLVDSVGSR